MAQKVTTTLIDDLDGTEATDRVAFSFEGVDYEIDLSAEHAEELRNILWQYVAHARRVKNPGATRRSRRGRATPPAMADAIASASTSTGVSALSTTSATGLSDLQRSSIREWGRRNGWQVKNRGRLPVDLIAAWEQDAGRRTG